MGVYPRQSIEVERAALWVKDSVISLYFDPEIPHLDVFLKMAILVSSHEASSSIKFYPFPYSHTLSESIVEETTEKSSVAHIVSDIQEKHQSGYTCSGETIPEFDWYENAKGASLPPILGGATYNFVDIEIDAEMVAALVDTLTRNPCPKLVAAARALVTSNQISCHSQFKAEAVGQLLDCVSLLHEIEGLHLDSAQLSTLLGQLGDSTDDYIISRQQMADKVGPIDFHRLFVQTSSQLRKFLLGLG
ncbi:hypothetical protein GCM10023151_14500 [Kangiella marina]|uniref:Uncharacterized protein n=2 Tax=Kangiella marina TaxID=1079178 RepID=A0ABP8IKH7_9GAMM